MSYLMVVFFDECVVWTQFVGLFVLSKTGRSGRTGGCGGGITSVRAFRRRHTTECNEQNHWYSDGQYIDGPKPGVFVCILNSFDEYVIGLRVGHLFLDLIGERRYVSADVQVVCD